MKIKIKKLRADAAMPTYARPGDAGLDLYSLENYELRPGERKIFDLGFAMEFEFGYAAIIKDKGSLPKNGGIHTMGGVFDAGYRGEYNVQLINLGNEPYKIEKGQKIAQLIIYPIIIADLEETDELSESIRGDGRFGSTGKKINQN
ncbi:MAG: dUTP diphosphatase [Patescibacteria group bacterium]|nr:dUTP diphosphatase [Patescibacteria group bacterium]